MMIYVYNLSYFSLTLEYVTTNFTFYRFVEIFG